MGGKPVPMPLSTTNFTWISLASNSGLSGKMLAISHLNHGTGGSRSTCLCVVFLYLPLITLIYFKCPLISAPIIFADNTSILFADSNLIDLNKNICIVFTTLNKWLRANQLSLNFNKTNYVHFTTNRNMFVNLTIILSPIAPTQNSWGQQ